MELLRFESLEEMDFPKLMQVYREGNIQTIPYFFPDETDLERGLRGVEEKFYEYFQTDFFAQPGRRYYVLADGDQWVSAVRLFPVPEQPGAWHAEALATAPDCRRRGYAKHLFWLIFQDLGAEGPFILTDTVRRDNAASLALHAACGFERFQNEAVCALNGKRIPNRYGMRYCGSGERKEGERP